MIDFSFTPELTTLKARTESFIRDVVIPCEGDPREGEHGLDDSLKRELMARAREAGLLSPHVGEEWGGLGLDMRSMAVVFEAAGYSLLGPQALNCAAPDEGNMHLLEVVANDEQKEQWLRPLAGGEIRSCFSMTEPDGAGSDPGMLATIARQDGNHWVINGRKWFITGYDGAKLNIVMARTAERIERGRGARHVPGRQRRSRHRGGAPAGNPGIELRRGGTTSFGSTICGSTRTRCWARSARATATPRCGLRRRGSPIACGGSAPRSARTTSRAGTRCGARRSASPSPSTKGSGSCSRTTSSTCIWRDS